MPGQEDPNANVSGGAPWTAGSAGGLGPYLQQMQAAQKRQQAMLLAAMVPRQEDPNGAVQGGPPWTGMPGMGGPVQPMLMQLLSRLMSAPGARAGVPFGGAPQQSPTMNPMLGQTGFLGGAGASQFMPQGGLGLLPGPRGYSLPPAPAPAPWIPLRLSQPAPVLPPEIVKKIIRRGAGGGDGGDGGTGGDAGTGGSSGGGPGGPI